MAIAETCHETLFNDGKKALMALERGAITEAVENVIEANILMSGLGFKIPGWPRPMEFIPVLPQFLLLTNTSMVKKLLSE